MSVPHKARILLIENDPELLELIPALLTSAGYEIRVEPGAAGGQETARSWKPALLLVGEQHGKLSATEVLESVRSEFDIPALLLLREASEEAVITSLALGDTDIIKKPFSGAELLLKLGHILEREKQRKELEELNTRLLRERSVLARYFSDDIVTKIMSESTSNLMGENLLATILFVDIRNFTSMSENLKPGQVAETLSFLYTDMMDLIFTNNGSVNKLIGDAILATFGCPFNTPRDATNAVRSAVAIRKTITLFNKIKPAYLNSELRIGMGIATGMVFAGNIGSYRRMEYTVIGDVVNIASRLQNLTKRTSTDLLIDKPTADLIGPEFIKNQKFAVRLRGKQATVEAFIVEEAEKAEADNGLTYF